MLSGLLEVTSRKLKSRVVTPPLLLLGQTPSTTLPKIIIVPICMTVLLAVFAYSKGKFVNIFD